MNKLGLSRRLDHVPPSLHGLVLRSKSDYQIYKSLRAIYFI